MQMRKSNTGRGAWNILRLAVLWARKSSVLKRRLMINLPKYIKSLRNTPSDGRRCYGERQLSFDATPVIRVKMHRPSSLRFKLPHIPCINRAKVDSDYDFSDDDMKDDGFYYDDVAKKSFLESANEEEEYYGYIDEVCSEDDDEGIDTKAEEFISNFYEQIKLQRQTSYLEYHDRFLTVDQN